MKMTILFLLAACLQVSATVKAQQMITLSQKDAPLETVFREIRKQTGYTFFCRVEWLEEAKKVSISVKNAPLEQVLDICFKDQPLTYTIVNKTIMVRPKEEEPKRGAGAPPAIDLNGRVTNEKGEPLQGATVIIKGSTKGVSTDANGHFELKQVAGDATVVVSFTGYAQREIKVDGLNFLLVGLALSSSVLDQSMVIAYGTTTKRLNPGDVTTISSKDIADQPVSNPLEAIEGRVPGMQITQNTGMPGGSFTVQIRGQNSIANGNDPLYIIDGVPYPSELLGNSNPGGGGNPLNFINTADIESISVLKDADATAIYGSRGANGVVLITTKKGRPGQTRLDVNVSSGVAQVPHFMDLMNTQQYLEMRHEALNNDGVAPSLSNGDYDLLLWDTTRYTNWQKTLIGGAAHYTDAQAGISGGDNNTQFSLSGAYHRVTTVLPDNSANQRGAVHLSVNHNSPDRRFKAIVQAGYVFDDNHLPQADPTFLVPTLAPDAPQVYNSDGSLNWAHNASGISTWTFTNPFSLMKQRYSGQNYNLIANSVLSYEVVRGLTLKTSLGYNDLRTDEVSDQPIASTDPALNILGNATFTSNDIRSWIIEPQANYQKRWRYGRLDVLAGATFNRIVSVGQSLIGSGYTSDALLTDIQAATAIQTRQTDDVYKYGAVFGRINYDWKDKYIIDATIRRDGSSRFGPDNQYSNFGAIGGAWIFSKENWIEHNVPLLSFGKLRGSYGITGNDQIGDYKFYDLYTTSTGVYQGFTGIHPNSLYNPNLEWEINKKLEGGLDLGFLKDRILLGVSYYRNRSSNQLVPYTLPAVTGFRSIEQNLAALVQNEGWEFSLTTTNIESKDFKWTSAFNLTIHRNKLLAYPGLSNSSYSQQYVIGQPLSAIKVYRYAGVDSATGVYQFYDSKGQRTFNPVYATDATGLVNNKPNIFGGLLNNFEYKGFQLQFFLQFVSQQGLNDLYNLNYQIPPGFEGYNQLAANLSRWQKPGDRTNVQQFTETYGNAWTGFYYVGSSNKGFTNTSYIRLKNLSLAYSLPTPVIRKMHLQACKVYVQAQNLLTITDHYVGLDPETQSVQSLPVLRVVTAGIQLSL